jgi:hypothetical protein
MGALSWAVALSMLSAGGYAAAAVVQERLATVGHRGWGRWAASLGLTGLGVLLHTVALGFGTVGVVQALGTLTLLFALSISALRTRTAIPASAWRDAGLTVAGLVVLMAFAVRPAGDAVLTDDTGRWLILIAAGTVAVLVTCTRHATPLVRGLLLAGASGVSFGVSAVVTKAVLTRFTVGGGAAVVVLALGGYLLGQMSYRGAGLAAPLAMVSVSNPVVAATIGMVVYGDGFRSGRAGLAVVGVASVLAAAGVVGLSREVSAEAVPAEPHAERDHHREHAAAVAP